MKEIALAIIAQGEIENPGKWLFDSNYDALLTYVYQGGIWDKDFRDKITDIRKKKISALTYDEINTYLTFICCTERTWEGCFEAHIRNGVFMSLMKRYIELEGA